ncbi:hypothetical protein F7R09_25595 [Pseudomonas vancouverensis]|uniref:Uncharacterized protein n=1 Tax=Pseudomonas vancouverensis TaxID=95300 RepID=A0A643D079_PSEVA|nr:hypothetical protein F7R09_25595 [Pseudomonas vancouverensis]
MFAMDINDDAGCLEAPVVPTFFASMLAPTEGGASVRNSVAVRPSSSERRPEQARSRKSAAQKGRWAYAHVPNHSTG